MENNQSNEYDSKSITKKEEESMLFTKLKEFNCIFNKEILKYFESLISLEISALNEDNLSKDKMQLLTNIDLYRQIVVYNIFYSTYEMCQKNSSYLKIKKSSNPKALHVQGICNGKVYSILDFQSTYNNLSTIDLYETLDNTSKRERTIVSLVNKISNLEEKVNLFNGYKSSETWKLELLKKELRNLEQRNSLYIDGNLYIATMQHRFLNNMLELYGVDKEELKEEEIKSILIQPKNKTSLNKILVKRYPHTTLIRNVEYY